MCQIQSIELYKSTHTHTYRPTLTLASNITQGYTHARVSVKTGG